MKVIILLLVGLTYTKSIHYHFNVPQTSKSHNLNYYDKFEYRYRDKVFWFSQSKLFGRGAQGLKFKGNGPDLEYGSFNNVENLLFLGLNPTNFRNKN